MINYYTSSQRQHASSLALDALAFLTRKNSLGRYIPFSCKIRTLFFLAIGLFINSTFAQVTTLNNWTNVYHGNSTAQQSVTYTVPTGSNTNRVLVVAIATANWSNTAATVTLAYGGQSLTLASGDLTKTSTRYHTALYYLKESGLDNASPNNLTFKINGDFVTDVWAAVFDNVNQTTPITDSKNYCSTNSSTVTSFSFASPLTINSNNLAVKVVSVGYTYNWNNPQATITYTSPWTRINQQTATSSGYYAKNEIVNRSIPGSNTTDAATTTLSRSAYASMTGLSLNYSPALPLLTVSPTSLAFGYVYTGNSSSSQNFQLAGTNLTGYPGNITITAPSPNFQVSNNNSTWGSTTTIPYSSATLATIPVYVRFIPQSSGIKSGNVTLSGGGVTTPPTVALSGTGTTPASTLTFVNFPATGSINQNFASFTVEARGSDNTIDYLYTGNITLSKASGPGNLSGTLTVAAVNGVATFNAVQVDQAGDYTLYANSGSLTQATSGTIVIFEATSGDYRSNATTMNWNTTISGQWQKFNGSSWQNTSTPPVYNNANVITIRDGHTVTITAGVTVDQVKVETGGTLVVNNALTIANGDGTDLDVNGTLKLTGASGAVTTNSGAEIKFESNSIYDHNRDGGTIPTANWAVTSTCLITGAYNTAPGGYNQDFGNFTWQSVNNTWLKLGNTGSGNNATTHIFGNLTIAQTGTGPNDFAIEGDITVEGDLNITAATSGITSTYRIAWEEDRTITVKGNVNMTGAGIVRLLMSSQLSKYGTLKVGKDFNHISGTIDVANSQQIGEIVFNGTGKQTYTLGGGVIEDLINLTVKNGSYLQMGTGSSPSIIKGSSGTFTLESGATLGITSPYGITTSATGDQGGNIQVTGTRTFNAGANYIYNGASAQVTGDGLPATVNGLTIANTNVVPTVSLTNNTTINGTLTLTSGRLFLGTKNLTLVADAVSGSFNANSMIVADGAGKVIKSLTKNGTYLIPVGSYTNSIVYSPVALTINGNAYSSAHVDVNLRDVALSPVISDNRLKRYWTISPSGITNLTYDADFTYTDADVIGTEEYLQPASYTTSWGFPAGSLDVGENLVTVTGQSTASIFTAAGRLTAIIISVPSPPSICPGSSILLQAAAYSGQEPYTYSWSPGSQTTSVITVSPSVTTTYTVTITDASNNTTSAGIQVDVTSLPVADAGPDVTVNQGTAVTITKASATGYPIKWTTTGTGTLTDAGTLTPTYTPDPTETGYVGLTLTVGPVNCSVSSEMVIEFIPTAVTWTGDLSDHDWNQAINWDPQVVPGATTNVTIPSGLNGNYPTVLSGDQGYCNNIILQSDATLVEYGNLTVRGTASVEREIPNDFKWHFLSSPVAYQDIWPEFAPAPDNNMSFGTGPWLWDFYYFNPNCPTTGLYWVNLRKTNGDYNNGTPDAGNSDGGFGNATLNNPPEFINGRGYLVAYNTGWKTGSPTLHTFTGNLHTGEYTIPIYGNNVAFNSNSYNLLGNPYPSAIDWKATNGWNRSNLKLNGSGYDYWIWNDTDGAYGAFNSGDEEGTGTHGVDSFIAPTQGFFVEAASTSNIVIKNDSRVHSIQPWLKNADKSSSFLRLKLTTNATIYNDEMVIIFDAKYSGGGTDKWWSFYDEAPELYSVKDDRNLCINRYGELTEDVLVNVGAKIGISGTYTITAANINDFTICNKVLLDDLKTGTTTDLKLTPSYTFTGNTGDDANRFRLIIGSPTGIDEPAAGDFDIYAVGNRIYVHNDKNKEPYTITVSNMLGQTMLKSRLSGNSLHSVEIKSVPGIYVVTVVSKGQISSKKILLR